MIGSECDDHVDGQEEQLDADSRIPKEEPFLQGRTERHDFGSVAVIFVNDHIANRRQSLVSRRKRRCNQREMKSKKSAKRRMQGAQRESRDG